MFLGLKRGRFVAAVFPLALQTLISMFLYRAFSKLPHDVRGIIVAAIVPLNSVSFLINAPHQAVSMRNDSIWRRSRVVSLCLVNQRAPESI